MHVKFFTPFYPKNKHETNRTRTSNSQQKASQHHKLFMLMMERNKFSSRKMPDLCLEIIKNNLCAYAELAATLRWV